MRSPPLTPGAPARTTGADPRATGTDAAAPAPADGPAPAASARASAPGYPAHDAREASRATLPSPEPAPTTRASGARLTPPGERWPNPTLTVVRQAPLTFSTPFGEGFDRQEGVRAASALVRLGERWIIAQDDANFAAVWSDAGVHPLRLFPDEHGDTYSAARGNKAHKPDLEAGAHFTVGGAAAAVFFGSGSTAARTRAAVISEGPAGLTVRTADLSSLYAAARQRLGLGEDALNLEAAAAVGERVLFFQRGNGAGAVNASFAVARSTLESALTRGATLSAADLREVRRHDLGALDGCPLGFSDAAPLPDGRVLFVAAAEASPNTYDDGAVAGSVLGVLELDGSARLVARVPDGPDGPYKLEGLAIERIEGDVVHLRATEDADDPGKASTALALRLLLRD